MHQTKQGVVQRFLDVRNHGFFRVAVVIPRVYLGNPQKNVESHMEELRKVRDKGAQFVLCPELGITGYSCGDLFHSQTLIQEAVDGLRMLLKATSEWNVIINVGMPLLHDGSLYNVGITMHNGKILAVVPKSYPPEYREFYELRHFARANEAYRNTITLLEQQVPFGTDILVGSTQYANFVLHTDICEDIWVPIPPGTKAALAGATVLANLSASNITIAKSEYREQLVVHSSAKNLAVQMYSAAGFGESTTDHAWDGQGIIAERGQLLKTSQRFKLNGEHILVDVDLDSLVQDRMRQSSFHQNAADYKSEFRSVVIDGDLGQPHGDPSSMVFNMFERVIDAHPFVPSSAAERDDRCRETFMIQATSLARRLWHLPEHLRKVVVGVSGGQDSTHALLVAAHAMDLMKLSRNNIIGITMPGFGTTDRTYHNACELIKSIGATFKEISITPMVKQLFHDIGQDEASKDTNYENCQAWTRKLIELSTAGKEKGIDLGTGDLSELMIGWTTMFGDHASHYGVNAGVPKTLISYLIRWSAEVIFEKEPKVRSVLMDILSTPISPELLPPDKDGKIAQKTEGMVGPYELHDFFGYYMVRFGYSPQKIIRMSLHAFAGQYSLSALKQWLTTFITRFFATQLKRSCLPDGPKVGLTCVSPRGDWRMPSDADPAVWVKLIEQIPDTHVK